MRRLLQVVHCIAQALASQHDQIEGVAENAEERDDRYQNLDDARDVDVLVGGRMTLTQPINQLANERILLDARLPRHLSQRRRRRCFPV